MEDRVVGLGAGADTMADEVISLGPHHPSSHGTLRLAVRLDGDHIATAEPLVGHLHRGAEKLFEVRDYRQIVVLANRHDWLSAFANELGVVLAVERLVGLDVPPRAVWLRTLLGELNRVLCHLAFLGHMPVELAGGPLPETLRVREQGLALMEEASGGRVHYMLNRVGGLKEDVPAGWLDRLEEFVRATRSCDEAARVLGSRSVRDRLDGVGVLSVDAAREYGVSGPPARAAGLDMDLRRDDPYLAYDALPVRVVTRSTGDSLARFDCLLEQVAVALDLVRACAEHVRSLAGPVNVRLPKVLRPPEGHTYAWTESPLGITGYYLVSRGEPTPWRLKLRSPSFNNVQALRVVLPGTRLADLTAVLASYCFVIGDLDK